MRPDTNEDFREKGEGCWRTLVIRALGNLRQEDCQEFEANLGYMVKSKGA